MLRFGRAGACPDTGHRALFSDKTNSSAKESGKIRAGMTLTHVGHDGEDPQELGSMSAQDAGRFFFHHVFMLCSPFLSHFWLPRDASLHKLIPTPNCCSSSATRSTRQYCRSSFHVEPISRRACAVGRQGGRGSCPSPTSVGRSVYQGTV